WRWGDQHRRLPRVAELREGVPPASGVVLHQQPVAAGFGVDEVRALCLEGELPAVQPGREDAARTEVEPIGEAAGVQRGAGPGTESQLEAAMKKLFEGRTAVVIAHHLETLEHATHILVLGEGRSFEFGKREVSASARSTNPATPGSSTGG